MTAKEAVLKHLKRKGIRPMDLENALGLSSGMASLMLSGGRGISFKHIDPLAKLLQMTPGELVTDSDLADHAAGGASTVAHSQVQRKGRSDEELGAAQARIQELSDQLEQMRKFASVAEKAARSLARDAARNENSAARILKSGRSRSRRKIG